MKKSLLMLPLCAALGVAALYVPAVANEIHQHTAHQCRKHSEPHSCSHQTHTTNALRVDGDPIDPAPDCYPCKAPEGCICMGDCDPLYPYGGPVAMFWWRLKNAGTLHLSHLVFGEPK